MKLNPDCIRDILLAVEETVDYYHQFEYIPVDKVHHRIDQYTHDEIVYHIHQCRLSGLLFECHINGNGGYITIEDLTPDGHEFLANIRKNPIWEKVKGIADEIGTESASSLAEIARLSLLQMIRNHFGIT